MIELFSSGDIKESKVVLRAMFRCVARQNREMRGSVGCGGEIRSFFWSRVFNFDDNGLRTQYYALFCY